MTTFRQQKRVEVFREDGYSTEWPPTGMVEFAAWLAEKLRAIPEEHRGTAQIEIGGRDVYGDPEAYIEIYYDRPETDDEVAAREAEQRHYQKARTEQELQTLATLKAKYGS